MAGKRTEQHACYVVHGPERNGAMQTPISELRQRDPWDLLAIQPCLITSSSRLVNKGESTKWGTAEVDL